MSLYSKTFATDADRAAYVQDFVNANAKRVAKEASYAVDYGRSSKGNRYKMRQWKRKSAVKGGSRRRNRSRRRWFNGFFPGKNKNRPDGDRCDHYRFVEWPLEIEKDGLNAEPTARVHTSSNGRGVFFAGVAICAGCMTAAQPRWIQGRPRLRRRWTRRLGVTFIRVRWSTQ